MSEYVEENFLEQCRNLSFQELDRYIKNCLRKLDSSQLVIEDVPIRKETYLELRKLLLDKADLDIESPTFKAELLGCVDIIQLNCCLKCKLS